MRKRNSKKLVKLDISSCFDSIYTHSLPWSTLGREVAKENLKYLAPTFGGKFDTLMQVMNRGETNGIVTGPEFSRIFAEIILQDVDIDLENILFRNYGINNRIEYEIFRYVDDYFLFCNDDSIISNIKNHLSEILKTMKLNLSAEKLEVYERPIITSLTIAKNRISECLESRISTKFEIREVSDTGENVKHFSVRVQGKTLITDFKASIKNSDVRYKDVLNYTLAAVERRINYIFRNFKKNHKEFRDDKELVRSLIALLGFAMFIYAAQPRVNFTVRLTRIVSTIVDKLHELLIPRDLKDHVFKYIFDNISRHVRHTPRDRFHEMETLYLLLALSKLGRNYRIPEEKVADFLGIEKDQNGRYFTERRMTYFAISVCLLYIRSKNKYSQLRDFLEHEIRRKFSERKAYWKSDAELIIAALDLQCCPYISNNLKVELAKLYDIQIARVPLLSRDTPYWFTNWDNFDLSRELDKKRAREVY